MGSCGTHQGTECWCNTRPDCLSALNVVGAYVLTLYADVVVILFCLVWRVWYGVFAYVFLAASALAIWAHLKTMLTDPGSVPADAQPLGGEGTSDLGYCAKCNAYKPRSAYHCSKCRRCVVRMDHHCPYTNNCVGAKNQKHMILFLVYCVAQALFAIALCGYYCFESHGFQSYPWPQRVFAVLLAVDGMLTLAFTGNMTRRQITSVVTGVGTIDRLKLAKGKTIAGGNPLPLSAVFGNGTVMLWWVPIDPDFGDPPDAILGYRSPSYVSVKAAAAAAASSGEIAEANAHLPLLAKS
ncbi:hypothetical protein CTAYLR_005717 [Chrysophaeum taylorii]|uniref:Palmitoyltransferase n=1 Tax=Chrysophaeum taylorii TaxID=2483200 RepID=A0AAD7UJC7_9STRA|nr:hypothetical protein CTAYLR_005717 [Chrysophaeum taylorii]